MFYASAQKIIMLKVSEGNIDPKKKMDYIFIFEKYVKRHK